MCGRSIELNATKTFKFQLNKIQSTLTRNAHWVFAGRKIYWCELSQRIYSCIVPTSSAAPLNLFRKKCSCYDADKRRNHLEKKRVLAPTRERESPALRLASCLVNDDLERSNSKKWILIFFLHKTALRLSSLLFLFFHFSREALSCRQSTVPRIRRNFPYLLLETYFLSLSISLFVSQRAHYVGDHFTWIVDNQDESEIQDCTTTKWFHYIQASRLSPFSVCKNISFANRRQPNRMNVTSKRDIWRQILLLINHKKKAIFLNKQTEVSNLDCSEYFHFRIEQKRLHHVFGDSRQNQMGTNWEKIRGVDSCNLCKNDKMKLDVRKNYQFTFQQNEQIYLNHDSTPSVWIGESSVTHTHAYSFMCVSNIPHTMREAKNGDRYSKIDQPNIISSDIGRRRHKNRKPYTVTVKSVAKKMFVLFC